MKPSIRKRGGGLVRKGSKLRPTGIKRTTGKLKAKKGKEKSISKLIKEADKLFSLQVRRPIPEIEYAKCYTCDYTNSYKKLHAGHFLSRYYKAARWHKDNARPQCYVCNIMRKGDAVRFRQNLIKEIGIERVEAVEALRDQPTKLSRPFLESLIQSLKENV